MFFFLSRDICRVIMSIAGTKVIERFMYARAYEQGLILCSFKMRKTTLAEGTRETNNDVNDEMKITI